jgi:hypothetical protein
MNRGRGRPDAGIRRRAARRMPSSRKSRPLSTVEWIASRSIAGGESSRLGNYSHRVSFLADFSPVVTIMQGGPRAALI